MKPSKLEIQKHAISRIGAKLWNKARSRRRSIHALNQTNELSRAEEQRLNQFGLAGQVSCGS